MRRHLEGAELDRPRRPVGPPASTACRWRFRAGWVLPSVHQQVRRVRRSSTAARCAPDGGSCDRRSRSATARRSAPRRPRDAARSADEQAENRYSRPDGLPVADQAAEHVRPAPGRDESAGVAPPSTKWLPPPVPTRGRRPGISRYPRRVTRFLVDQAVVHSLPSVRRVDVTRSRRVRVP